jgi:hypothetical protein
LTRPDLFPTKEVNRVNIETLGQPIEPASAVIKGA